MGRQVEHRTGQDTPLDQEEQDQEATDFYADPYMWISERRGTNSAGYCAYYVVVHNVRATGRKDCQWALYDDDGGFPLDSGGCPTQGGTVYSRSFTAAVSYRFVGSLFVLDSANQPHWAPTTYFP